MLFIHNSNYSLILEATFHTINITILKKGSICQLIKAVPSGNCKTAKTGQQCLFPFKFNKRIYNSCTKDFAKNGQPWCAVGVNSKGLAVKGQTGECDLKECHLKGKYKLRFSGAVLLCKTMMPPGIVLIKTQVGQRKIVKFKLLCPCFNCKPKVRFEKLT